MKFFAIIFAVLVAGSGAFPQHVEEVAVPEEVASRNLISDIVSSVIESVSQTIRDLGYDPFNVDSIDLQYALPVPSLFNVRGAAQKVALAGVSDIVINQMSYGLLTSRLTFDVSLPEISIEIGQAGVNVVVLSKDFEVTGGGKLVIKNVGIRGQVRVSIGIITGISIRDLEMNFYIDGIDSQIQSLNFLGAEISTLVNRYVNNDLFNAIVGHQAEISELIEIIAWRVIDDIL